MTTRVVLIPGFWLGAWAWDEVGERLRERGHEVCALTLPGLDPEDAHRLDATLADQARAIVAAIGPDGDAVLVAHSGGAVPAYLATDRAPERVRHAIYIDSAPIPDGFVLRDDLGSAREFALPSWAELEAEGNSLTGLDDKALARFRERAVSQPASIAGAPLELSESTARLAVPTTVVCTSIAADLVGQLSTSGEAPIFSEVPRVGAVLVDLPTGHWPMWSEPDALAELVDGIVGQG
ncbi:alpha/beta fold hydrolase [Nocardia bovistercoris]|uniref:Alpha/beta hydrolase n=1 Tax=Nocardia bovistercoris TaxID=2785916 RepID=A0A931IH32_9NOCA|nr:alpha/beta hydrolase [Nocardia bovistercoris]MBH0780271.1 alpha/beta hydrolase [Nocardia bovistercoris]